MTNTAWITIGISVASLIVGTIVTLSVAARHRKQLRQIEIHRTDPSVPLIPPPHPITQFFKTYGFFIISFLWNLAFLIREINKTGPVTRGDIFAIVFFTVVLFFLVLMEGTTLFLKKAMKATEGHLDRMAAINEATHKVIAEAITKVVPPARHD